LFLSFLKGSKTLKRPYKVSTVCHFPAAPTSASTDEIPGDVVEKGPEGGILVKAQVGKVLICLQ
jgi:hypothetical protein